jgi:exodeoxyribonuclease VII large subunit
MEDLWAFNDECLARALARAQIPTVSAVGHEIDFTIADFVADVRAPTPTAAAECVVPDVGELLVKLDGLRRRLVLGLEAAASAGRAALERLRVSRVFRDPQVIVQERLELVDDLATALRNHLYNRLKQWEDALLLLASRLRSLSPYAVLSRGYSVATDAQGRLVRDAADLEAGDEIRVRFHRGRAVATVKEREVSADEMEVRLGRQPPAPEGHRHE